MLSSVERSQSLVVGGEASEIGVAKRQIMRNGQNNNKRMRGRNNNNNNNNRKSSNPLTRVYESNGPDVKIRGTASHVAEKYIQLARDSQASGDPVAAENYYQHAEHYFRMIAAAQEQFRQGQQQPFNRPEGEQRDESFDGDDDDFQTQGEPGYGNREPQAPYPPRDNQYQPRDNQNYQNRDQPQPQYNREQQQPYPREQQPRPQPQTQPQNGGDTQPDAGGLPSFITGGAPQPQGQNFGQNGQSGHEGQGDRYPLHRRRRRHRGPRTDVPGGSQNGNDGNPPTPRPTND